jgi:oligopeptide transport system substrate-binding protein
MKITALFRAFRGAARAGVAAVAISAALPLVAAPALAEMVWNRGNSADVESLDPHKTSTVYEAHILRDLFEGLVMQDAESNLIPGAAESWTVSDDGTVYTFKIRGDSVWSNGDPVTADDFVYSFRRLLDPATGAEYASMLYVVKGGEAANAGEMPASDIGVRAIDAKTLEVTLAAPTPYFLELLTHQATYPVNPKAVGEFGDDWVKPGNMVSNGAFTLLEHIPNDHITVVKSPSFHGAADVKLDKVVFWPTEDRSTAMKRYEAGEIDSNDDFPTEQLADLRTKFGDQLKLGPYLGTYYYTMKWDKAPWDNVELRRAISMAIDRDFIADKVWGNTMIPAYGMVPPGIEGYASYEAPYAGMSQIEREDEAARILQSLGYGPDNPLHMEIRYNTSENHKNTAIAIQEQLKPLGVEVTMVNTDTAAHYAFLENRGDYDVARAGWIADYKDPESFLGISVSTSGNNYSVYTSDAFDAKMREAAAAGGDPQLRMRLLAEAEKILVDDLGNVPLLFYGYHNIVSPKVKGWTSNVMDIHPSRFVWIE